MQTCYDIIHTLIRTEKGVRLEPTRKYLFRVASSANKVQIKKAVEEIYQVKVAAVNTQRVAGKPKTHGQIHSHSSSWKKAVVTLLSGHAITVT